MAQSFHPSLLDFLPKFVVDIDPFQVIFSNIQFSRYVSDCTQDITKKEIIHGSTQTIEHL